MTTIEQLHEWKNIMGTQNIEENPEVFAGRKAEEFLQSLIETNLKYKGSFCFLGKRIPSKKYNRRFEIDLIVLTKKHIHILEVKNWSGKVVQKGDKWIQTKRNGEEISHPHLTRYNSEKLMTIINYLQSQNIKLNLDYFSQKVIFMKENLHISSKILSDPNVIPIHNLDKYLSTQKGTSTTEKFVHSVIEFCIDTEKSAIVLDGLYDSMNKSTFQTMQKALTKLSTWDKIVFNGGKIATGDCLKLKTFEKTVKMNSLQSGTQCKVAWNRSKIGGLMQALLTKMPMGKIKLPDGWIPIKTTDTVKFHFAGEKTPKDVPLRDINLIVKG